MFLVDKYNNDPNNLIYHKDILEKLLNSFDNNKKIYSNIDSIEKLSITELKKTVKKLENQTTRYENLQHLIVYGQSGCGKEHLVNKLLEQIYGQSNVNIKDVEYTISGYSNVKTKILIKQSKHHIIIEPNSNGFDKYLIQEIIQEYAKSEMLNIIKNINLFKVIIINKIDNLSYYAQASLRRTMEKYSDVCKFILISDQLSKIIEPLRSRCLLVRVPLPSYEEILETLLYICNRENINISWKILSNIIKLSDNKINHGIWLLEMYLNDVKYDKSWEVLIDNIIELILNNKTNNELYQNIKKIREYFYVLFITNISTQTIITQITNKLLKKFNDINLKYQIINITSLFEQRINQGTRHIIHIEAYVIKLIQLFLTFEK